MANQKDEDPNDSPTETLLNSITSRDEESPKRLSLNLIHKMKTFSKHHSSVLPLKKRTMANEAPESKFKIRNSDDGDFVNSSETLQQLQRKAYFSVILAFIAETTTISNKRDLIVERLKKQWKIPQETHISFVNQIYKYTQILQQRDEKELQIGQWKPLTKPVTSSLSFVPESGSSWGSVNPESLVGKCVRLRLEDEFDEYVIEAYDVKLDMHRLVTLNSTAMEVDDAFSLFDLREFPSEDIMWEGGQKPNFVVSTFRRASF